MDNLIIVEVSTSDRYVPKTKECTHPTTYWVERDGKGLTICETCGRPAKEAR